MVDEKDCQLHPKKDKEGIIVPVYRYTTSTGEENQEVRTINGAKIDKVTA